jgi:hypothetical protein
MKKLFATTAVLLALASPAQAHFSLGSPHFTLGNPQGFTKPPTGGGGGTPNAGWTATADVFMSSFPGTSYTATAVPIGTPSPNRLIVTCFSSGGTQTVTSVVVGGVSSTNVVADGAFANIWQAAVPTGTTANITVTYNATPGGVPMLVGALTTTTPANTGTAKFPAAGGTSPISTTSALTLASGGMGLVCASFISASAYTLNGTIDFASTENANFQLILGHQSTAGSWAPTFTGPNGGVSISAASWVK